MLSLLVLIWRCFANKPLSLNRNYCHSGKRTFSCPYDIISITFYDGFASKVLLAVSQVPHNGDCGCSTCNIKSVTVKSGKVIQRHTYLKITRQQPKGQQSLLGKMLNSQMRQEKR